MMASLAGRPSFQIEAQSQAKVKESRAGTTCAHEGEIAMKSKAELKSYCSLEDKLMTTDSLTLVMSFGG
jgi:hypothetical protein